MEEAHNEQTVFVKRAQLQAVSIVRSRYGLWGLCLISFIESALVVPLVTDPFLAAYILAHNGRVVRAVILTTVASVLGGVTAYIFAVGFFDLMSGWMSSGHIDQIYEFAHRFEEGTFILTLLGAVTPVPYTLVALAAGFVKGNFVYFLAATILGRGSRYALVGYLTHRFGQRSLQLIKHNIMVISIVVSVCIVLYLLWRYILA